MGVEVELRLFLRRSADGGLRLEAADGSLMVQSCSYRQLRRDLETILRALPGWPRQVKVFIGKPPRRPPPVRTESGALVPVLPTP